MKSSSKISVIVPVYNGGKHLDRVLNAVFASDCDNFEVIVIDDRSQDDSVAIAKTFPCTLILHEETQGAAAARNTGVQRAAGEILFFLDSDIIVERDTLQRVQDTFTAKPHLSGLFCSYQADTVPQNFFSVYKNLVHHYTHQTSATDAATFCGGYGALKKQAFLAVGGFDPTYRVLEDVELGYRLHAQGHAIFLNKDIQLTHCKVYSFRGLVTSDVFNRAIPWTKIMLHKKIYRNDLNTKGSNILSVVVAFLMVMNLFLIVLYPGSAVTFVLLWGALLALNWRFYRFVWVKRGWSFAIKTLLMNWFNYLYSGLGLIIGTVSYLQERFFPAKLGLGATSP